MARKGKKLNGSNSYHGSTKFKAKTQGQEELYNAIIKNEIVIVSGPAGCGKSFVSLAAAADLYKDGSSKINRIIFVRPAVSSEKLGYLPGTEAEKIRPYMRPMYDNLRKVLTPEEANRWTHEVIEECTLGYMRGMSIDNAVVILDEAQNTTDDQMLMFLSRIGYNSKMVVNGDSDQIDLPRGQRSGLITAGKILNNIEGIANVKMTEDDIVRNPIIQEISTRFKDYKKQIPGAGHSDGYTPPEDNWGD
jgi:phosphate starvation-inducible protein PhoH and related proteins